MTGAEQAKLDSYLDESRKESVEAGAVEWARISGLLDHVRARLEHAASRAQELGGETGPAASRAFTKSATAMGKKSQALRDGGDALAYAAGAIEFGNTKRRELGKADSRPSDPEPLQPGATDKEIAKHGQQQSRVSAWEDEQARRERVARETTTEMDTRFRRSTVTMKKIHGEPDPVPKPSSPGGSDPGGTTPSGPGGRTHQGPGSSSSHPTYDPSGPGQGSTPGDDGTVHQPSHDPGTTGPGDTPSGSTPTGSTPNGSAQTGGPGVPTLGGGGPSGGGVPGGSSTSTSVSSMGAGAGITGGAGLLGGAAMGGMGGSLGGLRGAVTPVSTSSAAVRPIGSTARGATGGTLGRSGTTVTGTGSGSGSGARGTGRSGGSTVRSRGAAGGRGSAGSSGSGGRGKGSKKSERDHLEEEWELDDEDVAPAVLD
jgi:hypothetical protein